MLAIIKELHRREHDVIFFTWKHSNYIKAFKPYCTVVPNTTLPYSNAYDAIIAMHRPMAPVAALLKGHKTMICNGPIAIELGIEGYDRYVSVSKEVKEANLKLGFRSDVIFNGIDLGRFLPVKPIREKLRNVLMISNHYPGTVNVVAEACDILKLDFRHIGSTHWKLNVEDYINEADLVVSLGRGAYEAMACGRNVIIYDYRGGDGFVTPASVPVFRHCNCSGRVGCFPYFAKQFVNQLLLYNPVYGPLLRKEMAANHDIRKVVDKLLKPTQIKEVKPRVKRKKTRTKTPHKKTTPKK